MSTAYEPAWPAFLTEVDRFSGNLRATPEDVSTHATRARKNKSPNLLALLHVDHHRPSRSQSRVNR